MAHGRKPDKELIAHLRAAGLRKKVAQSVASAVDGARSRKAPPKEVSRVIHELRSVAGELQSRVTGGSPSAKRSAAAKKAAATRKRNAATRSAAAKKAARTRAKKS